MWTILSVLVCFALAIKLMFFTDHQRSELRLMYRVTLFLSAVYAGKQVIWFFYYPNEHISPVMAILHLLLFLVVLFAQPKLLPWNCKQ